MPGQGFGQPRMQASPWAGGGWQNMMGNGGGGPPQWAQPQPMLQPGRGQPFVSGPPYGPGSGMGGGPQQPQALSEPNTASTMGNMGVQNMVGNGGGPPPMARPQVMPMPGGPQSMPGMSGPQAGMGGGLSPLPGMAQPGRGQPFAQQRPGIMGWRERMGDGYGGSRR